MQADGLTYPLHRVWDVPKGLDRILRRLVKHEGGETVAKCRKVESLGLFLIQLCGNKAVAMQKLINTQGQVVEYATTAYSVNITHATPESKDEKPHWRST
ncbi:unnamed protein product [Vitrella brassicaformis CCMP3155]|uniref:Uncharacterized protein n=1 Tax=Vitrella brassicaformis (strain CCMP3155) TaxID=1169540 RepID=A0A0G4FP81_VITBC|nr:unnamed protein product [Vitrella brassicaformis CCMP3155]|eukprot:CEM16019.1 unnamed protein product [Vitrella brassicaformis CCMP3155]